MEWSECTRPHNKAVTSWEGSKITSGPWRIEGGGHNLRGSNGEYIAVMQTAPTIRAVANALAIAALPELLESLEELVGLLDSGCGDEFDRGNGRMVEARERALAALAKAGRRHRGRC
jgi:hypothetical protein